ncbi:MAG: hypothetical protein PHO48_03555 [Candidatus Gracilibacteria bacterium]|nr:hypothetical protein [Candidatus Gracilibacteria bacterium]
MLIYKNQFRQFQTDALKPHRLVWEDNKNQGGESQNAEKNFKLITDFKSKDWEKKNLTDYQNHIKKALELGLIKDTEASVFLENARNYFTNRDADESVKNRQKPTLDKLAKLAEEKKDVKIAKRAKAELDKGKEGYIQNLRQLREFVRSEIESLGVEFTDKDEELFKAFRKFEEGIVKSVIDTLDDRQHRQILDEVESEKKRAEICWQKMRNIFASQERRDFLDFLVQKNIPAQTKLNIKTLMAIGEGMENYWDKFDSFIGITDPLVLYQLEDALDAVDGLYSSWEVTGDEDVKILKRRLGELDKGLSNLAFELTEASPSELHQKLKGSFINRQSDIKQLEKLLEGAASPADRRLVKAFLDGQESALQKQKSAFEAQTSLDKTADAAVSEPPKLDPKEAEAKTLENAKLNEILKSKGPHDHHGHSTIGSTLKTLDKIFTANGHITWYSVYDIEHAFKMIGEAWRKHGDAISDTKAGPLAEKTMFWREAIEKRILHAHLAHEQGNAEEHKKTYKNVDADHLISELAERPTPDIRRAILEVLAERGLLMMCNRKLVDTVCPGRFSDADWASAEKKSDFTMMREAFKRGADVFIGETNYGAGLLDKQAAGVMSNEESGKKLLSASNAISPEGEIAMFSAQIKKARMEGEGKLFGQIQTSLGMGNAHSNNGSSANITIRIDGHDKEITRGADLGLYGLLFTEGFVRGEISREAIYRWGPENEGGMMAFAPIQDFLARKAQTDAETGKNVCEFEYWGWIDESKGTITKLGSTEIPKFFNTRNAKAKIKDGKGGTYEKIIHIASDDSTYKRHSSRRSNIKEARNIKHGVGDKMSSYLVKNATSAMFNNATSIKPMDGTMLGETFEIASLIKSAAEDMQDGYEMMQKGERYYDKNTGKEIEGYNPQTSLDSEGKSIPATQVGRYGEDRFKRGEGNLYTMLHNLRINTQDRSFFQSTNNQFGLWDGVADDGTQFKPSSNNLETFMSKTVAKLSGSNRVMREMKLYKDGPIPTQDEIKAAQRARNKGAEDYGMAA